MASLSETWSIITKSFDEILIQKRIQTYTVIKNGMKKKSQSGVEAARVCAHIENIHFLSSHLLGYRNNHNLEKSEDYG